MGLCRPCEAGYYRGEGIVLVEPMGKHMHAHTCHMRRDPDHCRTRGPRPRAIGVPRASLATIEPPGSTPPVDMAQAHGNDTLPVGGLVEQYPTWALRLFLEQAP